MGSQFALVFDIITVAVIVLMFFSGWRRGIVNMVLGLCAVIVAFVAALTLSAPLSETVYTNYIEQPLSSKVDETIDKSFSMLSLSEFSEVDCSKVYISGKAAGDIELDYFGRDSAAVDMSDVDISELGLTSDDLALLGLDPYYDLTSVNLKTAEFRKSDVEKYGLGKLVVSHFITINYIENGSLDEFNKFVEIVDDYIPSASGMITSNSVTVSYARRLVLGMLDTRLSLYDTVMQNFVRPNCILIIRTIAFALIFAVVFAVLKIIAYASKLIEKIPVIGQLNSLLGGIAGVLEGIVIVFLLCVAVRLAVTVLDDSAILFNQQTIDNTFLFKRIYDFDFLTFLT